LEASVFEGIREHLLDPEHVADYVRIVWDSRKALYEALNSARCQLWVKSSLALMARRALSKSVVDSIVEHP
jgi:hypothetical protein